jgi:alkylation response protein AidB-like acyl-CoA dehydrogenase
MELEFSAEQDELRDGVRAVLERECPMTAVRTLVEKRWRDGDADADADELWHRMVELGWPALTIPEAAGGLGLGAVELAVVVEELGRVVAPGPYLPTVAQFVPAVREAGDAEQQARFLGAVATDGSTGTLAIAEASGSFEPASVEAVAEASGDGFTLRGTKQFVFEPLVADEIVVVARLPGTSGDDGVGAFVVPRESVTVATLPSVDVSRVVGTVELREVHVGADRVLGDPGPAVAAALRRASDEAVTALAVESVGTCQSIFDITLEYAKQREQFGVPIGSFQATKHKFADMLLLLERARATGYFAALTIAEDDDRRSLATSMSKAAAADAAEKIGKEGIQVHGGIGYTWEHDMHLYVRRAKASSLLFGTAATHRARVADLIGI